MGKLVGLPYTSIMQAVEWNSEMFWGIFFWIISRKAWCPLDSVIVSAFTYLGPLSVSLIRSDRFWIYFGWSILKYLLAISTFPKGRDEIPAFNERFQRHFAAYGWFFSDLSILLSVFAAPVWSGSSLLSILARDSSFKVSLDSRVSKAGLDNLHRVLKVRNNGSAIVRTHQNHIFRNLFLKLNITP